MVTIAVGVHKGGTAKTTTAFNLGHELARSRRVLLVDLDYQASLTSICGIGEVPGYNMTQVMTGSPIGSIIQQLRPGLDLAPADIELADVELTLANRIGRENLLKRALAAIEHDYDVCIMDCPPALGLLTMNALAAAQGVLIPLQPTSIDLRALELFLSTLNLIQVEINKDLQLIGVLLTFFDGRTALHNDAIKALNEAGLQLIGQIGRSVRVPESTAAHLPISEYEPGNPQTENYRNLTKEVERWLSDRS